jgi:hypothetical protein
MTEFCLTGRLAGFGCAQIHGWGYGLLQADEIEAYLLQYYALSAHAYTRGTWIAPESSPIDRTKSNPSFATPAVSHGKTWLACSMLVSMGKPHSAAFCIYMNTVPLYSVARNGGPSHLIFLAQTVNCRV